MSYLKIDIMKEVQQYISSQIKELALTLTIQVTNAIKDGLSQRPATVPGQNVEMELETDPEPITQKSHPTNEDITNMDIEVEPRKGKERSTNNGTDGTTVIISTYCSRQQVKPEIRKPLLRRPKRLDKK